MIQPAERLKSVSEYYFSRKGKEVARLNAEGKDIISLAIGSPDMPPSPQTIETLQRSTEAECTRLSTHYRHSRTTRSHGRVL